MGKQIKNIVRKLIMAKLKTFTKGICHKMGECWRYKANVGNTNPINKKNLKECLLWVCCGHCGFFLLSVPWTKQAFSSQGPWTSSADSECSSSSPHRTTSSSFRSPPTSPLPYPLRCQASVHPLPCLFLPHILSSLASIYLTDVPISWYRFFLHSYEDVCPLGTGPLTLSAHTHPPETIPASSDEYGEANQRILVDWLTCSLYFSIVCQFSIINTYNCF